MSADAVSATGRGEGARAAGMFLRDLGLVLASWVLVLAVENLAVGLGYRALFVGTWEMADARLYVSPIALAASAPFALACVVAARAAVKGRGGAIALSIAALGAAFGVGVSTGRHFAALPVRAAWVVACAAAAGLTARALAPRLTRLPPRALAPLGVAVAALAWCADAFVLPRLYPAFHMALFAITLAASSLVAPALARLSIARHIATTALLLTAASALWAPRAARTLGTRDNLRAVLVEHAPLLGRAVAVAARMAPPEPVDAPETSTSPAGEAKRALDWTGRDVVLVTIDALRADHVSAYGYARKTTPNIDAIAARGARFASAYCPTPHTSYSVTSLMTGKYMRPLLAMDLGEDSEMWADYMRRYGYRTGALYPPAVFFIDQHRFRSFAARRFDFEYVKEEFTKPELRKRQLDAFVSSVPSGAPLFLWVHLFEPHEPYEPHPEHPFEGGGAVDAYDSEIAAADAFVGVVLDAVRARRKGNEPVVVVAADHGEEFGDHGGRYHGSTVYEEQVRVPLVVAGPGVAPQVVEGVAQTIDVLPTVLSALGVPRPPRLRGRDLGPVLAGRASRDDGVAFAETETYTLVAHKTDRLICQRKIGSCVLYDLAKDPTERTVDVTRPTRVRELKRMLRGIEKDHGRIEAAGLPEALRRGLAGGHDAPEEVVALLDDARVDIRRAAAKVAVKLRAPAVAPQLARAASRDEDPEVRAWCTLSLVRLGERPTDDAASILEGSSRDLRVASALVLAERGDARGVPALVERWEEGFVSGARRPGELEEAEELLAAFAATRAAAAVPALERSLGDVRLRKVVARALADIGDARARPSLVRALEQERHADVRAPLARSIAQLGGASDLPASLTRFAGAPDAMVEALPILLDTGTLRGAVSARGRIDQTLRATARPRGHAARGLRLFVLAPVDAAVKARVDGADVRLGEGIEVIGLARFHEDAGAPAPRGRVFFGEVGEADAARVEIAGPEGAPLTAWLVARADDVAPPPPETWDGGVAGAPEDPLDAGRKAD